MVVLKNGLCALRRVYLRTSILIRILRMLKTAREHVYRRAVGAGPAGPATAGAIFSQLTRAKMLYELQRVVQFLLQNYLR